jgi:phage terminase large subunit GpA-like protein
MKHLSRSDLRDAQARVEKLSGFEHLGDARAVFRSALDNILPPTAISVTDCAINHRYFESSEGKKVKWLPGTTPYMVGIQDTCDIVGVEVVAVQGNARSGKTVGAENLCLRNWIYGPSRNVIWYMQTRADVDDYVEERVEWFLSNHEQISAKINWKNRRQSRARKRIGTSLARWLAATPSTTRGKAAPLIVADEIDGYPRKIRKAILTLLRNRQREYGAGALLYVCSHPDAGPSEGIASIIADATATRHAWYFPASCCGKAVSYNQYAQHRMRWNLPEMLVKYEGVEHSDRVKAAAAECKLVCPHCTAEHGEESRLKMSNAGAWLQPQQKMEAGKVVGAPVVSKIMGFVIHAFMSPFVNMNSLAEEWATAKLAADDTLEFSAFKEVVVKSLGEVFEGTDEAEKQENWAVVKSRLKSEYLQKTVPDGVQFLTAFVDVQGDRFEVVVIGWNTARESWLIDRYALKQWPGFENIDPANKLSDWNIIEPAVLNQTYPLARDPRFHLGIARVAVDTGGQPGEGDASVTLNARLWARSIHTRTKDPVPEWRVMLTKGDAHIKGELYGKPRRGLVDDHGQPLEGAPWERTLNVHDIKRVVIKRMKIEVPGPGRMHLPVNIQDRYVRELVSERLVNGEWLQQGRNETWDGWIACDAARATLQPERKEIDWINAPPPWARPFLVGKGPKGRAKNKPLDMQPAKPQNYLDRLVARNNRPE